MKVVKLSTVRTGYHYPQEISRVRIFVTRLSRTQAIVRPEELSQ